MSSTETLRSSPCFVPATSLVYCVFGCFGSQLVNAPLVISIKVVHRKQLLPSVGQVGEHLDTLSPQPAPVQESAAAAPVTDNAQATGAENMETEDADAVQAPASEPQQAAQPPSPYAERYQRLRGILTGSMPIQLYLEFLYTHNHADLQILRNMKGAVEARNSVCHSAVIFANATMHSGTTVDAFLRENLDWLSRATNWAKFNATAGLGVIHR